MGFLKRLYRKLFEKDVDEKWLAYYSKEERKIKFTEKTVYEYLLEGVGVHTDYYALNYFNNRITYETMLHKIDVIARSLKALGVKKQDIVTICMPNTPEAVETFYAINKIGAVADMIHPLSGQAEIKKYLEQSESRILLLYEDNYEKIMSILDDTQVYKVILASVAESMPPLLGKAYKLSRIFKLKRPGLRDHEYMSWTEFYNLGFTYHKETAYPMKKDDLAIILHSGGTTGTPKGIMISNYSFNALAQQGGVNVSGTRPKDKIVTLLPIFHGFGLGVCLHCPLSLKVEVILMPEYNANRFLQAIKKYKPNILAGVPTLWEGMMSNNNYDGVDLSSLKYVISGGDYMTIPMERKMNNWLHSHNAKINISKGYGMTESVAATSYTFDGTNEPGSIGIPMIGNKFCICKPDTVEELPLGEEGEICVYGPTIMMGYHKNPEETALVLRKHKDGKTWLHTGDAGYISLNGVIYFTQRIKRVIISSGFNVYPSVIEETIEKHPNVDKCCVIGIPHPYKMHVAKAYVVLKNKKLESKTKYELKQMCKKDLAAYSQPKEYAFVDSLPKTLYNKIDYKKLEMENQNEKDRKEK